MILNSFETGPFLVILALCTVSGDAISTPFSGRGKHHIQKSTVYWDSEKAQQEGGLDSQNPMQKERLDSGNFSLLHLCTLTYTHAHRINKVP